MACQNRPQLEAQWEGAQWQLVSYQSPGEVNTAVPGIHFKITLSDTTLSGNSGCNDFGASYAFGRQGQIEIKEVARTAQECPGALLQRQETAVLQHLPQMTQLQINQEQLILFNDTAQLTFKPLMPIENSVQLEGFYNVEWSLVALENRSGFLPTDNITMVITPEKITGFSGCNPFVIFPFIVESANLVQFGNMSHGFSTCDFAIDAQERAFFELLKTAESFELSNNALILYAPTGSLTFR